MGYALISIRIHSFIYSFIQVTLYDNNDFVTGTLGKAHANCKTSAEAYGIGFFFSILRSQHSRMTTEDDQLGGSNADLAITCGPGAYSTNQGLLPQPTIELENDLGIQ